MGHCNLNDSPWLENSGNFSHEQPDVMNMFEKMMRMDLNDRLVLHLAQYLVDVTNNIHTIIVNDIDPY